MIGRNIDFLQIKCSSDRETGSNLQSCSSSISTNNYRGQHYTLYYQLRPTFDYNQHQQYFHHITTPRSPYRTGYYKKNWINVVLLRVEYLHQT